jgi:hypothetical protein
MEAICVERYPGELTGGAQTLLRPPGEKEILEILSFALYLTSNDLLTSQETDNLLQRLIDNNAHPVLKTIFSVKTPTIEAAVTNVLSSAVRLQHLDIVRISLGAGANADRRMENWNTPLQQAIVNNNIELVRILLEAGAHVNARRPLRLFFFGLAGWLRDERTALETAARHGNIEIIRVLLAVGANIEFVTACGGSYHARTAILSAVRGGSIEIIRLFLEAGADVNFVTNFATKYAPDDCTY